MYIVYLVSFARLSYRHFENSLKIPYSDSIHCLRVWNQRKMSSFEKCVRNKAGILTLRLLLLCAEFIIFRVSIISIQWFDLIVSFSCSSHAPHTSTGGRCCVSFLFGQFQRGKKNILLQEARHVKVRYMYFDATHFVILCCFIFNSMYFLFNELKLYLWVVSVSAPSNQ